MIHIHMKQGDFDWGAEWIILECWNGKEISEEPNLSAWKHPLQ